MLVENETRWNTDDLKTLTAKVLEMVPKDIRRSERALLLFTTCRRRDYRARRGEPTQGAEACRHWDMENVLGVEIRSPAKLEPALLDRLAAADTGSAMSPNHVVDVAKAIYTALSDSYYFDEDRSPKMDWAGSLPIRARKKPDRSPEASRRRIKSLEARKQKVLAATKFELQSIDGEIEKLRRTIDEAGD